MSVDTTIVVAGYRFSPKHNSYAVEVVGAAGNIYYRNNMFVVEWANANFRRPGVQWFHGKGSQSRAIEYAKDLYRKYRKDKKMSYLLEYDKIPVVRVTDKGIVVIMEDCRL